MKENKAKKIILLSLALICIAVLVYSLYQGLIIYIPQKQEQNRFSELQHIVEQENKEESNRTKPTGEEQSRKDDTEESDSQSPSRQAEAD